MPKPDLRHCSYQQPYLHCLIESVSGGILYYDYDDRQQEFTPLNRLVSNGTEECTKVHGVAVLSSDENTREIVFTYVAAKKVKCLSVGETTCTVEVLSGTGSEVQNDGAKVTLSQPTSCCIEGRTIFVFDTATGTEKIITRPSGLLKYLEHLNRFLRVFGVHRRSESRAKLHNFFAVEAVETVE